VPLLQEQGGGDTGINSSRESYEDAGHDILEHSAYFQKPPDRSLTWLRRPLALVPNSAYSPRVLHLLRRHHLHIDAHFDWSLAIVWSWPAELLESLCGPGLELDTYEGNGFVALALVKTRSLRPTGWPTWTGNDFVFAGYRLFTRYTTREGRRLSGLKILEGGADSWRMTALGLLLTHYRYRHLQIEVDEGADRLEIAASGGHRLHVIADISPEHEPATPPPGSIFPDLRTARRFAGPMPYTFDYEAETDSMIRVEGVRKAWRPRENSFFNEGVLATLGPGRLANAFLVREVDYQWRRGIVERISGHE
jgi:Uncharacterized conserved protein (COG2071)